MLSINDFFSYNDDYEQKIVFFSDTTTLSKKAFIAQINALGNYFKSLKAVRFALAVDQSDQFTIALFALIAAGKTAILLPDKQPGTLNTLKAEYDILIDDYWLASHQPLYTTQTDILDNIKAYQDKLNIILFSSGSTGQPKKIKKSLAYLYNEVQALQYLFGSLVQSHPTYSSVSHQHLYGLVFYILWPLFSARSVCIQTIFYPEQLFKKLQQNTPLVLISNPTLLARLDCNENLSERIICFSAGSLLKPHIAQELYQNLTLTPYEILGSSETGIIAWRCQTHAENWRCFDEVELIHNNKDLLTVRAPFFPEGSVQSGDYIQQHDHKTFTLLGRADRIVKIEGKRLALNYLEAILSQHPWISECYAISLATTRQYIGVVIVLNQDGLKAYNSYSRLQINREFKNHLSQYFEATLLPKSFRYVHALPVNRQGKIQKEQIKRLFFVRD